MFEVIVRRVVASSERLFVLHRLRIFYLSQGLSQDYPAPSGSVHNLKPQTSNLKPLSSRS
jgi:hypothetical protein